MSDTDYKKTKYIQRSDTAWGGTQQMPEEAGGAPPASEPRDSNKTIFVGLPTGDAMSEPVAGWLVIIKGPGKGSSSQISYGVNPIGRDPSERANKITLNFNDMGISRLNHAEIIYEPVSRQFYAARTSNMVYINGQALLHGTAQLKNGDLIQLGTTVLRFVPFCGEDFDWNSPEGVGEGGEKKT